MGEAEVGGNAKKRSNVSLLAILVAGLAVFIVLVGLAGASEINVSGSASIKSVYPTRPVRFVVGLGTGGSNDIIARIIAQKLSELLGKQFLVDNRPGGGGSRGAAIVARANPDG